MILLPAQHGAAPLPIDVRFKVELALPGYWRVKVRVASEAGGLPSVITAPVKECCLYRRSGAADAWRGAGSIAKRRAAVRIRCALVRGIGYTYCAAAVYKLETCKFDQR